MGPPQHGGQQRWELPVEVIDRLHAGQHEVDLLAGQPRRQRRRPGVAVDPALAEPCQVDRPVGALGQGGVEAQLDVGVAEADHDDLGATGLLDEKGLLDRLVVPLRQDELEEFPVDVGGVVVELELLDEVRRLLDGNHDAHGRPFFQLKSSCRARSERMPARSAGVGLNGKSRNGSDGR